MGLTNVKLVIRNIAKPAKMAEGEFLVDSGSLYTVLPARMVKDLELQPAGEETFSLADATTTKRKVGNAMINFRGKEVPSVVVLGEGDDYPLLGVTTLEMMGLIFDPLKQKLRKGILRI